MVSAQPPTTMALWKAIVNGKEYDIEKEAGKFRLNGSPVELDIARVRANEFHVIRDDKTYNIEISEQLPGEKKVTIKVNGNEYVVELRNKLDLLLHQMGMTKKASQAVGNIKAPM